MNDPGPWASASDWCNRNRTLDPWVSKALRQSSLDVATETKLEDAYASGRSYGLMQLKYLMRRKVELARVWRRPPVADPW